MNTDLSRLLLLTSQDFIDEIRSHLNHIDSRSILHTEILQTRLSIIYVVVSETRVYEFRYDLETAMIFDTNSLHRSIVEKAVAVWSNSS